MAEAGEEHSIREAIRELSQDFSALLRDEVALAKVELQQGFRQVAKGLAFLLIAGFILNAGFLALVASVVLGVGTAMAARLSALIVGLILAIIGGVLVARGVGDMREAELKPERTLETLREDAKIVRERGHE